MAEKPLGVTIISVLNIIGAAMMLLGGIALLALGAKSGLSKAFGTEFGTLMVAGPFVFGIPMLVVGYGLWNMKKWAWALTITVEGLLTVYSLFSSTISGKLIGVLINGAIVYYFWKKKDLFA